MAIKFESLAVAVCLACGASRHALAQHISIPTARLTSDNPSVRADAFFELVSSAERTTPAAARKGGLRGPRTDLLVRRAHAQDDLALALIRLLERENAFELTSAATIPEGWGDGYYAYLGDAVAALNDRRSVKALVGAINLGYEEMHTVAGFGELAVPELLRELHTGHDRVGAASTLGMILKAQSENGLTDKTRASLKANLLNVVKTKGDYLLRRNAIKALETFSDEDIRALMVDVSTNEPAAEGSELVKEAANNWLTKHPR
jgi:hypothetical protein